MTKQRFILLLLFSLLILLNAEAQHTFAVTAGYGSAKSRLYPKQEDKQIWGCYEAGVSWRYYSLPKGVGCIGVDLEWVQRGFSYAPYASLYSDPSEYKYYTRHVNSIMLPIVWQPHAYLFKHHLRVYFEAAFTLSYNINSTFENREPMTFGSASGQGLEVISGTYNMRLERDNRFGYGLAAGAGIDFLFGQIEVGFRFRYNFGYSDIMKNRNKYYDNVLDQVDYPGENPFWYTPIRSPLDNMTFSLKVGWRFSKDGFESWKVKKKKRNKEKNPVKFGL